MQHYSHNSPLNNLLITCDSFRFLDFLVMTTRWNQYLLLITSASSTSWLLSNRSSAYRCQPATSLNQAILPAEPTDLQQVAKHWKLQHGLVKMCQLNQSVSFEGYEAASNL